MLRRRPHGAQMAGLIVGFLGVAIISFARGSTGSVELLGVLLVVGATMCYGLSINLAAPAQQAYGSVPVMAQMLMYAALWTTPLGVFGLTRSDFAWRPVLAVSFLGLIGTGIAFVFMATLVGRVGSTRGSTSTYVIPLVALVLGVVVLGDRVVPLEIFGSVLVIGGALLASRRET
jgi:drug/metabolite transporter (DMT)-like permease